MKTEARRRLLTNLGVLSPGIVQVLLQSMAGPEPMLVHPNAIRTLTRIGLIDRVHSESAARKALEKMVDGEELYSFAMFLTQHGEEVCQAKSPRCGDCVVVELCKFKRKVGIGGSGGGE